VTLVYCHAGLGHRKAPGDPAGFRRLEPADFCL
jgi:hypothetical protein